MSITLKQKIIIILIIILIIQVLITLYLLYDWWKNKKNINNKKENFLDPTTTIAAIPDAVITISHSRFGNWKYNENDIYKIKLKIGIEITTIYIKNNPLIYNNINNRVGLYFIDNQGNNRYIQHTNGLIQGTIQTSIPTDISYAWYFMKQADNRYQIFNNSGPTGQFIGYVDDNINIITLTSTNGTIVVNWNVTGSITSIPQFPSPTVTISYCTTNNVCKPLCFDPSISGGTDRITLIPGMPLNLIVKNDDTVYNNDSNRVQLYFIDNVYNSRYICGFTNGSIYGQPLNIDNSYIGKNDNKNPQLWSWAFNKNTNGSFQIYTDFVSSDSSSKVPNGNYIGNCGNTDGILCYVPAGDKRIINFKVEDPSNSLAPKSQIAINCSGQYNDNDIVSNKQCRIDLWTSFSGCLQNTYPDNKDSTWATMKKSEILKDMKLYNSLSDSNLNKNICYGDNKSNWPPKLKYILSNDYQYLGGDAGTGVSQDANFWRAKAVTIGKDTYYPVGDIVTVGTNAENANKPTFSTILVSGDVVDPIKYDVDYGGTYGWHGFPCFGSWCKIYIANITCPPGYISLGDVIGGGNTGDNWTHNNPVKCVPEGCFQKITSTGNPYWGGVTYVSNKYGLNDITTNGFNLFRITLYPSNQPRGNFYKINPACLDSSYYNSEVFCIIGTTRYGYSFTNTQAKDVITALNNSFTNNNITLATNNQLTNAYKQGADWCNPGWLSDDTLAAYPITTSMSVCGVVAGVIKEPNTTTMAGVNCFGIKPPIGSTLPIVNDIQLVILPFNSIVYSIMSNPTTTQPTTTQPTTTQPTTIQQTTTQPTTIQQTTTQPTTIQQTTTQQTTTQPTNTQPTNTQPTTTQYVVPTYNQNVPLVTSISTIKINSLIKPDIDNLYQTSLNIKKKW